MIKQSDLTYSLLFNDPIQYKEIQLYPITMKDILLFQMFSPSLTVRKDSIFHDKKIIKMNYLDFLKYCYGNGELEKHYNIVGLSQYYLFAINLLKMCCKEEEVGVDHEGNITINGVSITHEEFDDLRRIIIAQNGIDFDVDEFIHYDTAQNLLKAERDVQKERDSATLEDYIDSLVVALNTTENRIKNMTIRKFYRYLRRYQSQEFYQMAKSGEYTGMVSFKEPIPYWMSSLDEDDKYENIKTNTDEIKSKIG